MIHRETSVVSLHYRKCWVSSSINDLSTDRCVKIPPTLFSSYLTHVEAYVIFTHLPNEILILFPSYEKVKRRHLNFYFIRRILLPIKIINNKFHFRDAKLYHVILKKIYSNRRVRINDVQCIYYKQ